MPKESNRTFYRSVFEVEVLSEEPLDDAMNLGEINYEITEGGCSGAVRNKTVNQRVKGKRMARMLEEQGSDPGFFNLTENGADADEGDN